MVFRIFLLDMVVSILFPILGFLIGKVGLFQKYAFAPLTTVPGMGWKRDSNHFGPKWEKYLRGLFGHLKVNSLLCIKFSSSHYFIKLAAMIYYGWNTEVTVKKNIKLLSNLLPIHCFQQDFKWISFQPCIFFLFFIGLPNLHPWTTG